MSVLSSEQIFRYPFESQIIRDGGNQTLRLATFRLGKDSNPVFSKVDWRIRSEQPNCCEP